MQFPFTWLKEIISTDLPLEEIADKLTLAGLEVDAIDPRPLVFEGVIVGEVVETKAHPAADRLCIATVNDGEQTHHVVCGAPNCRAGLKVAYARVGSKIQGSKIKKGKLRGVESAGMLCSESELCLSEESNGIAELPLDWEVGKDLGDYLGDLIVEVSLTPNLGHCFSVLGIARELGSLTGAKAAPPSLPYQTDQSLRSCEAIRVQVEDVEACPRYACLLVKGVTVQPSPRWLVDRLDMCGMRSVNNIVDVTNLVMMGLGQPLHAFDYDELNEKTMVVRYAKEGEQLTTLDDQERSLGPNNLLICDGERPVAIAGVIGGSETEVSPKTTTILLEAAHFAPSVVRRSSKHLHVSTESSKRFERGCDPNGPTNALWYAAALIQELCGGQIACEVVDSHPDRFPRKTIHCRLDRANQLLGVQLAQGEAEEMLARLECDVTSTDTNRLQVQPPTYRTDLQAEIDIVEELGRLYGFENIRAAKTHYSLTDIPHSPAFLFEQKVRSLLLREGLQEMVTCSLISEKMAAAASSKTLPRTDWVRVLNPSSIECSILRPSLLPGLLEVVRLNVRHQTRNVHGFEIGQVHFHDQEELREQSLVGIILTGNAQPPHWSAQTQPADFYQLKGIVENLLTGVHAFTPQFQRAELPCFHPGRQALVVINEQQIGVIGEIHPQLARDYDLPDRVLFAELNVQTLMQAVQPEAKVAPLPLYPGSQRDWTIPLAEGITTDQVIQAIEQIHSRLLKKVSITAIYRSATIGEGWKNVTFRLTYRDDRKTVSDKAVDAEHQRIRDKVIKQLGEGVGPL